MAVARLDGEPLAFNHSHRPAGPRGDPGSNKWRRPRLPIPPRCRPSVDQLREQRAARPRCNKHKCVQGQRVRAESHHPCSDRERCKPLTQKGTNAEFTQRCVGALIVRCLLVVNTNVNWDLMSGRKAAQHERKQWIAEHSWICGLCSETFDPISSPVRNVRFNSPTEGSY
jgi:hypothetical protein